MTATAKLFTHGGSQAVRLPKAFRFEGTEVSVRREGDAVILEPLRIQKESWEQFWAQMDALGDGEDFPDAPPDPPSDLEDPVVFDD